MLRPACHLWLSDPFPAHVLLLFSEILPEATAAATASLPVVEGLELVGHPWEHSLLWFFHLKQLPQLASLVGQLCYIDPKAK